MVALTIPGRGASQTPAMRSGSAKGSGFSSTASTTLNMATLAPMPSASTPTTTAAKPGARRTEASPYAKSLPQRFDPSKTAALAMLFLHLFDASEAAARRQARLRRRQAARHALSFRQLQMGENLVIQLAIQPPLAGQRQQSLHHAPQRHDDASRKRATSAVALSQFATSTRTCFRPAAVSE